MRHSPLLSLLSLLVLAAVSVCAPAMSADLRAPRVAAVVAPAAACFYEHPNFQGQVLCVPVGQHLPALDRAQNNEFSSVQIPPGLWVTVCAHRNFHGRCVALDRDVTHLRSVHFNDRASSIAVDVATAGAPGVGAVVPPRRVVVR